jgi:hypothetical protein
LSTLTEEQTHLVNGQMMPMKQLDLQCEIGGILQYTRALQRTKDNANARPGGYEGQGGKTMKLIIEYKNGRELTQLVHWLELWDGDKLAFVLDKNPHGVFQEAVTVPLENITRFRVEKGADE